MLSLGILGTPSLMYEAISQELQNESYSKQKIDDKGQVEQLDGLIITLEAREHLGKVIEWLLICQQYQHVFVWVVCKEPLVYEEDILLSLGANYIVSEGGKNNLNLIVENTFKRLSNERYKAGNSVINFMLNDENQSMITENGEIILTRIEFKLMTLLYDNKERTISYDEITEFLWPKSNRKETYKVANIIFRVRKKMEHNSVYTIKNVRSKGYRFSMKYI